MTDAGSLTILNVLCDRYHSLECILQGQFQEKAPFFLMVVVEGMGFDVAMAETAVVVLTPVGSKKNLGGFSTLDCRCCSKGYS